MIKVSPLLIFPRFFQNLILNLKKRIDALFLFFMSSSLIIMPIIQLPISTESGVNDLFVNEQYVADIRSFLEGKIRAQSAGAVEHTDCIPEKSVRLPPNECPRYDTKLYLMVRIQFWNFEECGVTLHCHYSLVHSDPEWYYLLEFHLQIK